MSGRVGGYAPGSGISEGPHRRKKESPAGYKATRPLFVMRLDVPPDTLLFQLVVTHAPFA